MTETPAYRLIGAPNTRAMRVIWALEELGLAYEMEPAPPRSEAAMAVNPTGKVPTLMAEGQEVRDSVAAVTYLADRHGDLTHSAGTLERARQDAITNWLICEMDAALWTAAKHKFALPAELRREGMKETAAEEFARAIGYAEATLGEGPWLTGERFTIPDILLAHGLLWAGLAKFRTPESGPLPEFLARAQARPAFARAMATI